MSTPHLSEQQNKAVSHVEGPLLVVAGPGSGKTRVLTERIRALLTKVPGHFRVLALTFTNKAADEMRERLTDLGNKRQHAFIGTLHSFCLELLATRGAFVGIEGTPHIFENFNDRKEILLKAVREDPLLTAELEHIPDPKARNGRLDDWLRRIAHIKSHPITCAVLDNEVERQVLEAYDASLRACGAYDFDDLLLLAYRLFTDFPKVADFYRRLYRFVCIDEAQDLNEAHYAVLCALCGDSFKNVMMVGDPKQSIYGFNTAGPEFMWKFRDQFGAAEIELTENFRSAQSIVNVAKGLESKYSVAGQCAVQGAASLLVGDDEADEARKVVDEIERLFKEGHPDVEQAITPSRCAILGRTRFALLAIEKELMERNISHHKRSTATRENESTAVDEFLLGLRVMANPKDLLHFGALFKKWKVTVACEDSAPVAAFRIMAAHSVQPTAKAVAEALQAVAKNSDRLDLMPGFAVLKRYADTLDEGPRREIYEDVTVFQQEWDQYLRTEGTSRTVVGFLSCKALGGTQHSAVAGVSLLTVHAAKGLEFDVVFIAGMAEGVFPDYRANGKPRESAEEARNAFVAVTRARRLLYLSYPKSKMMPWGDSKAQVPSRFLRAAGLLPPLGQA